MTGKSKHLSLFILNANGLNTLLTIHIIASWFINKTQPYVAYKRLISLK
jgi:hypothetical protein